MAAITGTVAAKRSQVERRQTLTAYPSRCRIKASSIQADGSICTGATWPPKSRR
jgi:hypothetical protein